MVTATVTSKCQITIPKGVRERMGIQPGDQLEFVEEGGIYYIRKRVDESPFEKWRGYLKHLEGRDADEFVREMRGH